MRFLRVLWIILKYQAGLHELKHLMLFWLNQVLNIPQEKLIVIRRKINFSNISRTFFDFFSAFCFQCEISIQKFETNVITVQFTNLKLVLNIRFYIRF